MDTFLKIVVVLLCFFTAIIMVSYHGIVPETKGRYAFHPHKSGDGVYIMDTYTGDVKLVGIDKVYEYTYDKNFVRIIPIQTAYSIGKNK